MATFLYKARRLDGSSVTGTLPAETERAALNALDRMGLFPLELAHEDAEVAQQSEVGEFTDRGEAGGTGGASLDLVALFKRRRIGAETASRFARQLADLAAAGVPILKAIDAVSMEPVEGEGVIWGAKEAKDDARTRIVLRDVRRDVAQGASLADALKRRGELFSSTAISLIRAGEEGGFLPTALRRVAVFSEREMALARRIKGALTYPVLLCGLSSLAIIFLLTWVVPRFAVIYEDMGGALPLPTKILMATGDALTGYWFVFVGAILAGVVGMRQLLSSEEGRKRFDAFLLRVPLLRGVIAQASIARFGRTLGTLLTSGVGILKALQVSSEASGNLEFEARLSDTVAPVREGAPLAEPLRETRLFPPEVLEMLEVAQETGNLAEVLEQVGERADEEVDHALRIFITVLEPTLIVAVAGVVFFVVLAALLPVFSLNTLIK